MCESQSLRLFDEIAARVAFVSERRFRHDCEPLMNVHQKHLSNEHGKSGSPAIQHTIGARAILSLGAIGRFSAALAPN
jgi:hypothetical protein